VPDLLTGPLWTRNASGPPPPFKIRLALHAARLHRGASGWSGDGLERTARLVDADAARTMLADPGYRLATVLSGPVYREIIWKGYGKHTDY
jgi:hypothetical protein